jgi:hypothetical protein
MPCIAPREKVVGRWIIAAFEFILDGSSFLPTALIPMAPFKFVDTTRDAETMPLAFKDFLAAPPSISSGEFALVC